MKVLIVGLGSIAKKHINAIKNIAIDSEIYAIRSNPNSLAYDGVKNIFSWHECPSDIDFIIISNPSSEHYQSIIEAIKFGCPIFIEKPPVIDLEHALLIEKELKQHRVKTYIAFNLRFHPVINWLKTNINPNEILEVSAYCGSYLPDWRKGIDYRNCYSAKKELGGGVHLDLIHELDYLTWIFGFPNNCFAIHNKVSDLDINSSDYAHYYLSYPQLNISVTLNYYRRDPKRQLEIVTKKETIIADVIEGIVRDNLGNVLFETKDLPQETYNRQMLHFLQILKDDSAQMNGFAESIKVLKICLQNA
jgi:predicted dehydrogenase